MYAANEFSPLQILQIFYKIISFKEEIGALYLAVNIGNQHYFRRPTIRNNKGDHKDKTKRENCMPKAIITPDVSLALGPHQKAADGAKKIKGYKKHEGVGKNNDFRNITKEFLEGGKPVDLSKFFANDPRCIWVLANAGDEKNPRMELIIGREHPLSELRDELAGDKEKAGPSTAAKSGAINDQTPEFEYVVGENQPQPGSSTAAKSNAIEEELLDLDVYLADDKEGIGLYLQSQDKTIADKPELEKAAAPKENEKKETPVDKKDKNITKPDKEKMMGHATLSHNSFIAGEIVHEGKEGRTFRWLEWPPLITQEAGSVMSNKSGRFGEGNKPVREGAGVHKNDLLELAAKMYQLQTTGASLVGTRLLHHKTDLMKTVYDLHEKYPKVVRFILPQRSKWQPLSIDPRLTPVMQDIATKNAEGIAAQYGEENITTIDDRRNIPIGRNTLGIFVGQDKDKNFYFKPSIMETTASFTKITRAAMPEDVHSELAQPLLQESIRPTTVILELGKSPPRQQFNNTVRQAIAATPETPEEPPLDSSTTKNAGKAPKRK